MKLCRFAPGPHELHRCGIVVGEEVFDVALVPFLGLEAYFTAGDPLGMAQLAVRHSAAPHIVGALGAVSRRDFPELRWRLADVRLEPPIQPVSFRDFYAFEEHVRSARRKRGLEMVPEWYDAPAFYFSNTACFVGDGAEVLKPEETAELDYELEIAAVIGTAGGDIPVSSADAHIVGFCILNDWSARDVQRREMKVGLGPAKGKDFATSLGPYLVIPDELDDRVLPDRSRGRQYDLTMTASVNGSEYSRGNLRDMRWTFAELVAEASRNTVLLPGDLIGSGTVGTGCITEFPEGVHPWLQAGDVVRLEIEGLGALTNTIADARTS